MYQCCLISSILSSSNIIDLPKSTISFLSSINCFSYFFFSSHFRPETHFDSKSVSFFSNASFFFLEIDNLLFN